MAKDKELKDQRIPIMMTPSELEAIDEWSFKNRIRSRGEAIRRLCQIGITQAERDELMTRSIDDIGDGIADLVKKSAPDAFTDLKSEISRVLASTVLLSIIMGNRMGGVKALTQADLSEMMERNEHWKANLSELEKAFDMPPDEFIKLASKGIAKGREKRGESK